MVGKSIAYGILAGIALLAFYLTVVSIFQGIEFAIFSLRGSWYWLFALAIGFGTQIGLYTSIKHTRALNAEVAASGGLSGGSMVACCAHFILNIIPIIGFSAVATFLVFYQKFFIGLGIVANLVGIFILIKHKRKMEGK